MADLSDFLVSFDGYSYTDNKARYREEQGFRTGNTPGANLHGNKSAASFFEPRRITASFEFQADDTGTLDALIVAFRAAHGEGPPRKLYIKTYGAGAVTGQYIWAQPDAINGIDIEAPITYVTPEVSFLCTNPFFYDYPAISTDGDGSGITIAYTGTMFGTAKLSLIVGAAGKIVISNALTGESFTLYPDGAATYNIESDEETESVRKGTTLFEGWDGSFIHLLSGSNILTYTKTEGATVTDSSAVHSNRYR